MSFFFFILHPSSFILLFAGVCWGAAPAGQGVLTPGQVRLVEMRVTLAWLSDPLTEGCQVEAKWMGAALEVSGRAPSSFSKQRALELAQQVSPVPVLDGVRVVPGQGALRMPAAGSFEDLAARLAQTRAGRAVQGLAVWPEADGRLIVSGSVSSVEEKLAVSVALRELGMRGRVCNRLAVRPVIRWGELVTPVSADGRYSVKGRATLDANGDSGEVGFLPATWGGTDAATSGAAVHVRARRKPRRRAVEFASARSDEEDSPGESGIISAAAEQEGPTVASSSGPARNDKPAAPEPLPSSLGESRAESETSAKGPMLPTADLPSPTGTDPRTAAVWPNKPVRVWPPAHDIRPRAAAAPRPGPALPVATTARPVAQPSHLPGPDQGPAEESEPTPPVFSSRASPEAQELKQSIDRLCGRFAHYVEIIEHPEGAMVVRIQVPNDALQQILLSRVLTIPQVGTQKVRLETIVKP